MRLVIEEQKLKEIVKENRNDPEIYTRLQRMILVFLRRKKSPGTIREVEDVSYTMAGDIFLKIVNGEDISYFLGYFERWYKGYFREYYEPEKFDLPYDPSRFDESFKRYEGGQKYDEVLSKEYLRKINLVVETVMDKVCKYKYKSPEYINLELSLLVTLIRDTTFSFHLTEDQSQYLRILKIAFYEEVKREGLDLFSSASTSQGGSII